MIDKTSLSAEWLAEKRRQYKKDPGIIESMIHALYLLDQLKLTGLDFIFKGGTSLILLMEKPLRFSVDIDIIVSPSIAGDKLVAFAPCTTGVPYGAEKERKLSSNCLI